MLDFGRENDPKKHKQVVSPTLGPTLTEEREREKAFVCVCVCICVFVYLCVFLRGGMSGHIVLSPNEEEALRLHIVKQKRLERMLQVREREKEVARSQRGAVQRGLRQAQQKERQDVMVIADVVFFLVFFWSSSWRMSHPCVCACAFASVCVSANIYFIYIHVCVCVCQCVCVCVSVCARVCARVYMHVCTFEFVCMYTFVSHHLVLCLCLLPKASMLIERQKRSERMQAQMSVRDQLAGQANVQAEQRVSELVCLNAHSHLRTFSHNSTRVYACVEEDLLAELQEEPV